MLTLVAEPKKNDELEFVTGLKTKDEVFTSSKKLSLLLSSDSKTNVEVLLSPFETNGNFPVVGDGCAYRAESLKAKFQYNGKTHFNETIIQLLISKLHFH